MFKYGKNHVYFQSYGYLKSKIWLFFVISDDSKKLVTAWVKHLNVT